MQRIELSIDGKLTATATCDDISYSCPLFYKWSLKGVRGQHTITFRSYDWVGNVGSLTVTFTVG